MRRGPRAWRRPGGARGKHDNAVITFADRSRNALKRELGCDPGVRPNNKPGPEATRWAREAAHAAATPEALLKLAAVQGRHEEVLSACMQRAVRLKSLPCLAELYAMVANKDAPRTTTVNIALTAFTRLRDHATTAAIIHRHVLPNAGTTASSVTFGAAVVAAGKACDGTLLDAVWAAAPGRMKQCPEEDFLRHTYASALASLGRVGEAEAAAGLITECTPWQLLGLLQGFNRGGAEPAVLARVWAHALSVGEGDRHRLTSMEAVTEYAIAHLKYEAPRVCLRVLATEGNGPRSYLSYLVECEALLVLYHAPDANVGDRSACLRGLRARARRADASARAGTSLAPARQDRMWLARLVATAAHLDETGAALTDAELAAYTRWYGRRGRASSSAAEAAPPGLQRLLFLRKRGPQGAARGAPNPGQRDVEPL